VSPVTRSIDEGGAAHSAAPPLLEGRGIVKRFQAVTALDGVDVALRAGTVHALVGENGAGKSTLGRVLAGILRPDEGEVLVDGEPVDFRSPRDALDLGVTAVTQETTIVPKLSVAQNVFLGLERRESALGPKRQLELYEALREEAGFGPDGRTPAGQLRISDQQQVELLRAVARRARVILLDEPTASLTAAETERLHRLVKGLRERGTSIVYVSHFLDEVLDLADDITVLRNGRLVRHGPAADETVDSLVEGMLGRSLEAAFPAPPPAPDRSVAPRLEVTGLSCGAALQDVSLAVHPGEILGIAGLVGSGRSELARAIFCADRSDCGTVRIDGDEVVLRSPQSAVKAGIAFLPESRKEQGLVVNRSIQENVSLAHLSSFVSAGFIRTREERSTTVELLERLAVSPGRPETRIEHLSGGNQQKVMFAKWLCRPPKILIADEPTRGVDIGAKRAIYDLLVALAGQGMALIVISSELEEVLNLSHRVAVMRRGRIVGTFAREETSEEHVMRLATAGERLETEVPS
jgi:ABC-type sugar transport system ATPase subunit